MDYETARANMIERQIRPWNVLAEQTLRALARIRREQFVPMECRELAFADVQIPLGDGEVMLEPKVGARMMEALDLDAGDAVLEVGAGSGYLVALLASVCAHVVAVEINPRLLRQARDNLARAGVANVTLVEGDAHAGWPGRFDAILISGSLPQIIAPTEIAPTQEQDGARVADGDSPWLRALADGGRLVGIEGHAPAMQAVRLERHGDEVLRRTLFETVAPRLRNVVEASEFVF
ncbi:MAG: protein-L-isoaspartate O-methyltransferase family protein [bacterium]